ncbi:hypothetical protein CMUST_15830 (plasmid) [Corynebacterium mustelae]|uniref:Uncharacterized protein n=1 Tax=Corynebacterium mustelae TaxID=571915 RepID=A0A0G3H207_9CORY|nr:hypothetical protein [Corynebacterium mustelae]AKK05220.1 hypothetical protein CMUST_04390 [Corynebacterium mustelae]AKK07454.1 hypothetical protein CMUST_15830 [Corynebacterium mustelae]
MTHRVTFKWCRNHKLWWLQWDEGDHTHLISIGPDYPMIYGDYLRVLEKIRTNATALSKNTKP